MRGKRVLAPRSAPTMDDQLKRISFNWYDGDPNLFPFIGRIWCYKGITVWIGRVTVSLYWGERNADSATPESGKP